MEAATSSHQIFGQRLDASSGQLVGGNFQISDVGHADLAFEPEVAFNAAAGEYLVIWEGNVPTSPPNELEIFGVRVNAATDAVLAPAVRLTHQGADGDPNFGATKARVAWNGADDEYLVVFEGTRSVTLPLADVEIYGQRVDRDGSPIGTAFRVSAMGPEGETGFAARDPDVAFNPARSEYLVIWSGSDDRGALHSLELEVFGQRLHALGGEVGADDFRISFHGTDGDPFRDVEHPALAWNGADGSFLVVWEAPTVDDALVFGELEVFAQRLSPLGGLEDGAVRLSDMGPDGDPEFGAHRPAVAANGSFGDFFVAWHGDDDTPPLTEDELEVFGCNFGDESSLIFLDGFETGNTSAWSSVSP